MRNLKRALSLALAFVMVLSMMVIGAGAVSIDDFSDKDEIVNTEAVMTMVSLGVINGKDDGTYDPSGIVTRAEMAKLIAVVLNGGKDPTLGAMTANFTDTAGHWAESYIAYVANLKLIDGRGDGTFGPNDQVTGAQAAKMILTMLGYRSDIEGFTGANWSSNVQLKANDIDLFDGLVINPDEGLTRDNTAQMLYNAVQSWMVEYRNLEGSYDGVVYPQPLNGTKANSTVLIEKFKVSKVEGVVVANDIMDLDDQGTTVSGKARLNDIYVNGEHRVDDNGVLISDIYPVALDNSYLGQRVVLYVKGLKDLAPNAASTEVVGLPIISQDNTVATTASRLGDADDVRSFLSDNDLTLSANGVAVSAVAGTVFYTKDETLRNNDGTNDLVRVTRDFAVTSTSNVNGTELTFIDHDGDGVVDYIFKTIPTMAKVTAYNESDETVTIAGEGALDFDDVANYADVAKDDIVLYYLMNDTYYLSIAETVSGKVESYDDSNKTVSIDGTSYGKSTAGLTLASTDLTAFTASEEFINNTYTFYLDAHGNVVGWVLGEETLGNYAIILGTEGTPSNVMSSGKVKLLLADNTTANYDVNLLASANRLGGYAGTNSDKENTLAQDLAGDANHDGVSENDFVLVNRLVTYSVGDDGTVTLTDPTTVVGSNFAKLIDQNENGGMAGVTAPAGETVERSNADYIFGTADGNVTITVNDSTLFFIDNGNDDPTVVVGVSNLPTDPIDSADGVADNGGRVMSAIYTTTTANRNIAKAVWVNGYYAGTKNFVYVSKAYTAAQPLTTGETIYTYPVVFTNGETGTIQVKGTLASDDVNGGNVTIAKGNVYEYVMNGNYAELSLTADTFNGMVTTWARGNAINVLPGAYGGTNALDDATAFTVDGEAQIWNVEDTSNVTEETLTMNMSVAFARNSEGLIEAAFVRDTDVEFRQVINNVGTALTYHNGNTDGHYGMNDEGPVANGGYILVANGFSAQIMGATGAAVYDVTYDNSSKNELNQTASVTNYANPALNHNHATLVSISVPANGTVTIKSVGGILPASAAPTITTQPTAGAVSNALGGTIGTVAATGTGTLTYEWFVAGDAAGTNPASLKNNAGYEGATTATLSVKPGILNDNNAYYFYCVVTNTEDGKGATSVETDVVTVNVTAPTQDNALDSLSSATEINAELAAAKEKGLTVVTLTGSSAPTARIDIPDGVTLQVTGDFTDANGVRTTGTGKLEVAGVYTNSSGVIYNVQAGSVVLNANATVSGTLTTGAITSSASETLTVATGATLDAASVAKALTVSGTATISGAVSDAADVKAGGTLSAASVGGALTNEGTATVTGTVTGNVTVDGGTASVADVASTSTVAVNGGKLTLTGATLTTTGGITMAGGELDASACDISNSKLELTAAATATVKTLSFATGKAPVNFAGGTITVVDAISADSSSGTTLTAGTWNFTGMFTLDGTQTTTIAASTTVNFNGGITFAAADKLLSGGDNTSKFTVGDVTSNTITGEAKIKDFGGANAAGGTARDLKGLSFEGASTDVWNCTVNGTDWS